MHMPVKRSGDNDKEGHGKIDGAEEEKWERSTAAADEVKLEDRAQVGDEEKINEEGAEGESGSIVEMVRKAKKSTKLSID